jgi:hypothetical protein
MIRRVIASRLTWVPLLRLVVFSYPSSAWARTFSKLCFECLELDPCLFARPCEAELRREAFPSREAVNFFERLLREHCPMSDGALKRSTHFTEEMS